MFDNISPLFKSVLSTLMFHVNLRNTIFVGSFCDFVHYKRQGYEPIKLKDIDIIVTSLDDLGQFRYLGELVGPCDKTIYHDFLPHTQYFMYVLGVKIDIYVVNTIDVFNSIDTDTVDFFGHNITINSKEQAMKNQESYIRYFDQKREGHEDLYRLRKHSKRLSFYNMINAQVL